MLPNFLEYEWFGINKYVDVRNVGGNELRGI